MRSSEMGQWWPLPNGSEGLAWQKHRGEAIGPMGIWGAGVTSE